MRSTKPISEGILFESCDEGLRLTCTDLALGIETLLPATFSEEGRAVLPGKLLSRNHPQAAGRPMRHQRSASGCRRLAARAFARRSTVSIRWNILNCRRWRRFELPQNTLKDMVGRTLFAIAQDESRPILTGCLMEISQPRDARRRAGMDTGLVLRKRESSSARLSRSARWLADAAWATLQNPGGYGRKRLPVLPLPGAMCA
ncbi:MAG: hypothetical protein ACLUHE_15670 [Christensenellales bacterium]